MNPLPKISFGMIVLNGEPFVRYNLRALYPFAFQIIVAEGGVPGAAAIATPDGHSSDGTLELLRDFQAHEDPEHKVMIVTAEDEGHPNGFWPGEKDEQSQAYARIATGDYLWQIDVDEFYKQADMQFVLEMLRDAPDITAVSFKQTTFWGGFDYITDGWYLRRGAENCYRVFKWGPEFQYVTHRPPTVCDSNGRDLRNMKSFTAEDTSRLGIYMYHYSLVFPKQVRDKCLYYRDADWARRSRVEEWSEDVFTQFNRPYRVHNVYEYPSWLQRFSGPHPVQIELLREDIETGAVAVELRPTEDIERVLASRCYRVGRALLQSRVLMWVDGTLRFISRAMLSFLRDPKRMLTRLEQRIGWRRSFKEM